MKEKKKKRNRKNIAKFSINIGAQSQSRIIAEFFFFFAVLYCKMGLNAYVGCESGTSSTKSGGKSK